MPRTQIYQTSLDELRQALAELERGIEIRFDAQLSKRIDSLIVAIEAVETVLGADDDE